MRQIGQLLEKLRARESGTARKRTRVKTIRAGGHSIGIRMRR